MRVALSAFFWLGEGLLLINILMLLRLAGELKAYHVAIFQALFPIIAVLTVYLFMTMSDADVLSVAQVLGG
jgi:hypothetical protein